MDFKLSQERLQKFAENDQKRRGNTGEASFINESGVYPFKISYVRIQTFSTGSKGFTIVGSLEGQKDETVIYGQVFQKADGTVNAGGFDALTSLQTIFGLNDLTETTKKVKNFKDGSEMEIDIFKEFENKKCFIRVVKEFSKYNDKINRRINFVDAFRVDDKANSIEIINKKDFGKKYKWYLDNEEKTKAVSYKDGLTKAEVDAYYKSLKAEKDNETAEITDEGSMPF